MQILASYFSIDLPGFCFFPWSMRGSCLLPPGFYPGQLLLSCCPQRPEMHHPWDRRLLRCHGLPIWSLTVGASYPFWVRGDGGEPERHRLSPYPGSCRQLLPRVLRVFLTTVMCLSNCFQEASCCLLHCCFSYFCPPLQSPPPVHS